MISFPDGPEPLNPCQLYNRIKLQLFGPVTTKEQKTKQKPTHACMDHTEKQAARPLYAVSFLFLQRTRNPERANRIADKHKLSSPNKAVIDLVKFKWARALHRICSSLWSVSRDERDPPNLRLTF